MRRGLIILLLMLGLTAPALAVPVLAADDTAEPKLRNWHFGVQGVTTWRDRYDVFDREVLPGGAIEDKGRGAGFVFGRRFGDRFLVDLQVTYGAHKIADSEHELADIETLVTFTILYRERSVFQPFLRGGAGGAGQLLEFGPDGGHVFAFGTGAIAGGGFQVRLGSRWSLEFETVATFANFLEVMDESEPDRWVEDSWQVRESSWGWRNGVGVVFWF